MPSILFMIFMHTKQYISPANFPLSLTEKIKSTLRDSLNAWFNLASFCGGVDHTPFALDNVTFSALLLLITKKRASRNK